MNSTVRVAETAKLFRNVVLGAGTVVEDFCIIGQPPGSAADGEHKTVIGEGSHIRAGTIIYAGNQIGSKFQTGNRTNIREFNVIGNNVSIGTMSVIEHHVKIADNVRIHTMAFVPEYSSILEGAWIGPNAVLTNAKYPASQGAKDRLEGPLIEERAKIGANATLLPGVRVGRDSLVGAGAVVVRDVPPTAIVAGSPAKTIGNTSDVEYYRKSELK